MQENPKGLQETERTRLKWRIRRGERFRERERRRERDKSNDMGMNEAVVSEEEALKPAPGFK